MLLKRPLRPLNRKSSAQNEHLKLHQFIYPKSEAQNVPRLDTAEG